MAGFEEVGHRGEPVRLAVDVAVEETRGESGVHADAVGAAGKGEEVVFPEVVRGEAERGGRAGVAEDGGLDAGDGGVGGDGPSEVGGAGAGEVAGGVDPGDERESARARGVVIPK